MTTRLTGIAVGLALAIAATGCAGGPQLSPATLPLSKEAMMLLGKKGMKAEAPLFVRIFKEESELEVWKLRDDGFFHHFKTYPICTWSGDLGPKLATGDKQAPEGFYTISKSQMNPNSSFHLAFNLGYPNVYDRAHGRTGSALMVHGKCSSAGCYAMTDALMEEIYALARETFDAGHPSFQVHAYPFRMTDANMARHKDSKWFEFWRTLKEGYDHFETARQPPPILVCGRRYHVNAKPRFMTASMRLDPAGQCPALEKMPITAYVPPPGDTKVADLPVVAPGPKMRAIASADQSAPATSTLSGLLNGSLPGTTSGSATRGPALGLTAPGN